MKTRSTLLALATLSLALGSAHAEEAAKPHAGHRHPKLLKFFDKDADGKLSDAEKAAAKAHRQAVLAQYDTNKDGKLEKEERQARRQAIIGKYDADKDGKLNDTERKAAFAAGDFLPRAHKHHKRCKPAAQ